MYRKYLVLVDINLSCSSSLSFYNFWANPKLSFLPHGMSNAAFQIKIMIKMKVKTDFHGIWCIHNANHTISSFDKGSNFTSSDMLREEWHGLQTESSSCIFSEIVVPLVQGIPKEQKPLKAIQHITDISITLPDKRLWVWLTLIER